MQQIVSFLFFFFFVLCIYVFFFLFYVFFFFFQAEDGIRDRDVTGVQTCALRSSSIFRESFDSIFDPSFDFVGFFGSARFSSIALE